MKLVRFSIDVFLFYAAYAWPAVIVLYAVVHFRYPALMRLTKRLDAWQGRANARMW